MANNTQAFMGLDKAFKAYDIRGRLPDELNAEVARQVGLAYAAEFAPRKVVVGHDIRLSSPEIAEALISGLLDAGVSVYEIGQCGTEEVYFATFHYGLDGGLMVTASHNPKDYNGIKLVRESARPVSADTGLMAIKARIQPGIPLPSGPRGIRQKLEHRPDYIEHLLGYVDFTALKPLRIVVNPGNGGAGPVIEALAGRLPFEFIPLHAEPDGHFPNGVPNPLLPENREETARAVRAHKADLGVAWDGDFDRCFFFDERGEFVETYYLNGLLAGLLLRKAGGGKAVYDPRLTWATIAAIQAAGGEAVISKSGHSYMKAKLREVDGVYAGEVSGHHYFRDFGYCDSGMIPWLLIAELLCRSGKSLSSLVAEAEKAHPCSGEINLEVSDPEDALARLEAKFGPRARNVERIDGLSFEYPDWRFNLRKSNTEPLVRLNVETRGDRNLLRQKTEEILAVIRA